MNMLLFPCFEDDWHGFNAGVLFFRVDARSLEIARTVLSFSRTDRRLKYAEQDALRITYEQQKLVESGEVVMMPNEWFNSLDGQSAFLNDSAASVMVHYPSKKFKRSDFLPLLRKMVSHSGPSLTEVQARHRNRLLTTATSAFWDEYRRSF